MIPEIKSTTILCVRRDDKVSMGGDGQVSMGNSVMKGKAIKVRKLSDNNVLAGIAGAGGDAITLFELFESEMQKHHRLQRAAIEVARLWRSERSFRQLDALMIVADAKSGLLISGKGDVISSDDGVLSIGSGSGYAIASARTMMQETDHDAATIVSKALNIAADICIYTNHSITIENL